LLTKKFKATSATPVALAEAPDGATKFESSLPERFSISFWCLDSTLRKFVIIDFKGFSSSVDRLRTSVISSHQLVVLCRAGHATNLELRGQNVQFQDLENMCNNHYHYHYHYHYHSHYSRRRSRA